MGECAKHSKFEGMLIEDGKNEFSRVINSSMVKFMLILI